MAKVLKQVSDDHNLNYEELLQKYLPKLSVSDSVGSSSNGLTTPLPKKKATSKKNKQDYLEVIEYKYGDAVYYMDKKMNIYSYDKDQPKLLGIKLVDGTIKFY